MAYKEVGGNAGNIVKWDVPGKSVEDRFIGAKNGKVFQGKQTRPAILEAPTGVRRDAPLTTVLERRFDGGQPGALVGITYIGIAQSKGGTNQKDFKLEVDDGNRLAPAVPVGSPLAGVQPPAAAPTGNVSEYEQLALKLKQGIDEQPGQSMLWALDGLNKGKSDAEKFAALRDVAGLQGVAV